ncbi:hypothetical protein F2Q68_00009008 [Brassica cretica]|uniref:Bicarbonate transporter-like transmembrane domain-containing protein n=1 Tax=Brassica cretica TaxID=69181 RepID=A0A8S9L0C8_BRACR|nr:hypothetical protein F2Q68_00009008 [Brassica cretica]
MEEERVGSSKRPFRGIIADLKGRALYYKHDWVAGLRSGFGILAPTTYVFFASALPVIAFGEQLSRDTDGVLSPVETLTSTALCGVIHSILGGQPLLILGVAEPTVLMYVYLYHFAKGRPELGKELFLAWAAWVCVWTALLLVVIAIFNVADIINRFTRIAGELFGMLIAVLFIQQTIKVLVCGLLGLPPSNGVLPQSPMHTKSLAVLKRQLIRRKMVMTAKESMRKRASSSQVYENMQEVFIEMDKSPLVQTNSTRIMELQDLKDAVMKKTDEEGDSSEEGGFDPEKHLEAFLPVRVNEQRVSNLLQSLLVAGAVLAIPAIKLIPTSLLWGYFAYMAIDSLPGNQFFERTVLLFVPPSRRFKVLEGAHASFVEKVPYKSMAAFTMLQIFYFGLCYGVTWIPVAGIMFPVPFFLLIAIRQYLLPKLFKPAHLRELDASEYEEIPGTPRNPLELSFRSAGSMKDVLECDAEILDELTTSRGELRVRPASLTPDKGHQGALKSLPKVGGFFEECVACEMLL